MRRLSSHCYRSASVVVPPSPPPMPLSLSLPPPSTTVSHTRQCEAARACSAGAITDKCRHSSLSSHCHRLLRSPLRLSATTRFRILVVLLVDPLTGAGRWIADVRENQGIWRTSTTRVLYRLHQRICRCNVPTAPTFTSSFLVSIRTLSLSSLSSKALETSSSASWLLVLYSSFRLVVRGTIS